MGSQTKMAQLDMITSMQMQLVEGSQDLQVVRADNQSWA